MKLPLLSWVLPVVGSMAVLLWRLKETRRPLTRRRIVVPPLAMSTGFCMFFYPPIQMPLIWALGALLAGATLFAIPLIRTSTLKVIDGQVYLRRSRAFLWVLLALVLVRLALRETISHYITPLQTAGLFFLLAFGMIVHWRFNMMRKFKKLARDLAPPGHQDDPDHMVGLLIGYAPLMRQTIPPMLPEPIPTRRPGRKG